MKAIKTRGYSRSSKKAVTTETSKMETNTFGKPLEKPSPLDFEAFVPWLCLQWELPMIITVTKTTQEDSIRKSKTTRSSIDRQTSHDETSEKKTLNKIIPTHQSKDNNINVPVKSYYDFEGRLVEISIERCPFDIHRKVIRIIGFCLTFHSSLYKLTIKSGGVTDSVLYEIGKLLPLSNLTNICLDNNPVTGGNFHTLLEQTFDLKNLSLNGCSIEDFACSQIAANIHHGSPGCNLLTLELGSNQITNEGAILLGVALRNNNKLLHLNLSGNVITSTGALSILNVLMEYPLSREEILEMKRTYLEYCLKKISLSAKNQKKEMIQKNSSDSKAKTVKGKRNAKIDKTKNDAATEAHPPLTKSAKYLLEELLVQQFTNIKRDGWYYCVGNMTLCSLNLAYNNLDHFSIKKIVEVLKYQDELWKPPGTTGLVRLRIDGNNIPEKIEDYDKIEMYLDKVIYRRLRKPSISSHKSVPFLKHKKVTDKKK